MGLLDAFMATWSQARRTYGESTPTGGGSFDHSASLHRLQADVAAAAPGRVWGGSAANAYAARNHEHSQRLEDLAALDVRLAAEIDRSALVVATGRADLDNVRAWVVSAASSVPDNRAGELMLMPIVSRGIGQVHDIVSRSSGELTDIGSSIEKIGAEYAGLTGPLPAQPGRDDDLPVDETTWYAEWEALNQQVRAHNAALAAHLRLRPPPGSPPSATIPWNSRAAALNAEAERLHREQLAKVAEAAELGLSVEAPSPPQEFDDPADVPRGAVPARFPTPAAGDTPNKEPTA